MLTINGIGRLGRAPQMQYNPQGTAITNISVAVDTGYGDNKNTVWVSLVAFGAQAEAIKKYFDKGDRIAFSGELQRLRAYAKKDETLDATADARLLTFSFVDKNEGSKSTTEEVEEF